MKKYIYGTALAAVVVALGVFLTKPPQTADRSAFTTLAITFRFPEGYEFTGGAPFTLTWRTENAAETLSAPVRDRNFNPLVTPYQLIFTPASGSKAVILNARLYYCHKASRMCFQDDFKTRVPLGSGSSHAASCVWDIAPKEISGLGTRT